MNTEFAKCSISNLQRKDTYVIFLLGIPVCYQLRTTEFNFTLIKSGPMNSLLSYYPQSGHKWF